MLDSSRGRKSITSANVVNTGTEMMAGIMVLVYPIFVRMTTQLTIWADEPGKAVKYHHPTHLLDTCSK